MFLAKSPGQLTRERSGSISLDHMSYNTNKTAYKAYDPFEIKYTTTYQSKYKYSNFSFYGLLDSRDSKYTQTYSRYYVQLTDPFYRWNLKLGDSTHHYTPLSLNGRRIRGVKTDINLLSFINTNHQLSFYTLWKFK